ncbi:MAG: PFL family protein [Dehalococcoidales bacterium]|nr:PFL family protein [Dehalococcoidales bacterium]
MINTYEILETIKMISSESLDIRTITMGISLRDCAHNDMDELAKRIYDKITRKAEKLVKTGEDIEKEYGIPITNKRISVTPISIIGEAANGDYVKIARAMDRATETTGVDFIGGYTALVHKGYTDGDRRFVDSIPEALSETERVCASVNIATTKAGINMDAVSQMGQVIKKSAELTAKEDGIACAKLVVFCNAPEDNPFMAGAFHGIGEPECVINVGVSGPGVMHNALKKISKDADFTEVAETIKKTAFKITRVGQLVANEASRRLGVTFGIVDLSLAPTPAIGDSIANIIEDMGLERCGAPGTTAALAMLNDAVKKGGTMASSQVGGLSGAFIPVSEDSGMVEAVKAGALSLEKLEAMTCVCSVGLDMIAIPGDTPDYTIAAIIADEAAIGMINNKTTAVRIIPVPGKKVGDFVQFGGLLGSSPIMAVNKFSSKAFIARGGRIPAPIHSLRN